jgi:hypothetical protein
LGGVWPTAEDGDSSSTSALAPSLGRVALRNAHRTAVFLLDDDNTRTLGYVTRTIG